MHLATVWKGLEAVEMVQTPVYELPWRFPKSILGSEIHFCQDGVELIHVVGKLYFDLLDPDQMTEQFDQQNDPQTNITNWMWSSTASNPSLTRS